VLVIFQTFVTDLFAYTNYTIYMYISGFCFVLERRYIELFLHSNENSGGGYSGNSYGGGSIDLFVLSLRSSGYIISEKLTHCFVHSR